MEALQMSENTSLSVDAGDKKEFIALKELGNHPTQKSFFAYLVRQERERMHDLYCPECDLIYMAKRVEFADDRERTPICPEHGVEMEIGATVSDEVLFRYRGRHRETGELIGGITVGEWAALFEDFDVGVEELHERAVEGDLPGYVDHRIVQALKDEEYIDEVAEEAAGLRQLLDDEQGQR